MNSPPASGRGSGFAAAAHSASENIIAVTIHIAPSKSSVVAMPERTSMERTGRKNRLN